MRKQTVNTNGCPCKKRTAIREPYACVSNGKAKALRLSESSSVLAHRCYIKTSTGETLNFKSVIMNITVASLDKVP